MTKFKILKDLLIYKDQTMWLSIDFNNKDVVYFKDFVKNLTILLIDLSKLSDKGYVNKPNVDLPVLLWFLKEYRIIKNDTPTNYSIWFNTFFFNLLLLLLLNTVIKIEKHCLLKNFEDGFIDVQTDLATIRKNLLKMIHPNFRKKITNRGLSIILNSLVGYDSEYELNSSLKKMNDLLSVQLAGSTGLVLKVPVIDKNPIDSSYLNSCLASGGCFKGNEKKFLTFFSKSFEKVITDIRSVLCEDNDNLLERFTLKLDTFNLKSITFDSYKVYLLPKSEVKTFIKYTSEYTSKDLITDSDSLNNVNHENSLQKIIEILNDVCGINELSTKMKDSIKNSSNKPLSRITYKYGLTRLSITINRILTICMHESAADLSMLKDFDTFKENLDIVHRSFVTLGKPLTMDWCKSKVHFRDTVLLAPTGVKSLAGVGSIYGEEFKKIDIGHYRGGKMLDLLRDNKDLFEKYAIQDSIITLKHASSMEDFNYNVNKIGVPLTLSSIGKSYVVKEWSLMDYKGYQPRLDMNMGNLSTMLNPKGARSVNILNYITPFIAGYRGGRNESYMYGVDDRLNDRQWIDYDLTSCYTTVMSILGDPDYDKAAYVFNKTVEKMNHRDLLLNYIIVDVEFKFPDSVKYPCIPTRVDDNIDIYPKEGRSIITGCEYFAAKSMGCRLRVRSGVIVPFKKSKQSNKTDFNIDYFGPFKNIVKELQFKRRQFEKKTFFNYMYKEIGNSIYGQIAMGISGRTTYDVKTKKYIRIQGGVLSNPILASYITGFTRALIGECMNNIQELGGKIVSTTTDGFITDVDDLENQILGLENDKNKERFYCLKLYRLFRKHLTTFDNSECDPRALEIKNLETSGIITFKTRGQMGFTNGGISAMTGFQTRNIDRSFLIEEFSRILKNDDYKVIEFVQNGLRSASDIYKNNGHVIATYKDRSFSVEYDNKRRIIDPNKNYELYKEGLLDSKPWNNVVEYAKIRVLKETITKPVFVKGIIASQSKSYKSYIETSVRGFVKACLSDNVNNRFGIPIDRFDSYKSIIDFIHCYEPAREVKLSYSSMSNLKHRNTISRTVPRTPENEGFIAYVKDNIVDFNTDLFFKELSDDSIRKNKKLKAQL